jgi:hypothetical protein
MRGSGEAAREKSRFLAALGMTNFVLFLEITVESTGMTSTNP